jgi:hypothetical protein
MGSATASDPANHNISRTGDPEFSEAITDTPDSIAFWVKFTPNGHNENARMKATLHDNFDYQDPESGTAGDHVVASAELNYANTNGWVRKSVPFDYTGPASTVEYILLTFATNETPGGGAGDDEVLIDDVELIYNDAGITSEELVANMNVYMNNESGNLVFNASQPFNGSYDVYDLTGKKVQQGNINKNIQLDAPTGIYIVNVTVDGVSNQYKVYKK